MKNSLIKELTAALSIISVGITLMAAQWGLAFDELKGKPINLYLAAVVIAATAAFTSILVSRRIAAKRKSQRVFLIYARDDYDAARKIANRLKESGLKPWLDVDEIAPGQNWRNAISSALEESAAAIVLISKNFGKSSTTQNEVKTAMKTLSSKENNIGPVIPVRIDETEVPWRLSHIQWVNLSDPHGITRMIETLKRAL